ncbi:hypothetical protein FOF71_05305 [Lactobacillus paragasseri]|uniref:Uncharacterized protein n=1 Tax=Lactobacillus paragasseri TaxID=2107999 RepID=A0AAW6XPS4_9LACO|nr:hypothetical protein [Lactobacillus paragasseri]MDK6868430.1 hypothetical protein [Lactobacillus paragasseri]TVV00005.1 hypothetical protein FOF71_05305 [Lactobacillus paragasseri]
MKKRKPKRIYAEEKYNTEIQNYRGIKFKLIVYTEQHFAALRAKRFLLISDKENEPSQNFWIPNCYLEKDGTLKPNVFVDWIFVKCVKANKFKYAGIDIPDWMRGKL